MVTLRSVRERGRENEFEGIKSWEFGYGVIGVVLRRERNELRWEEGFFSRDFGDVC